MNMGQMITNAKQIKTNKDLETVVLNKAYVFMDSRGKLLWGTIDACDCGKKFYINAIGIVSGISKRGFEMLDIDECTVNPDTDDCDFCSEANAEDPRMYPSEIVS